MTLSDAIQKPPNPPLLTQEEQQVIQAFRTAKEKYYADLIIKIQGGRLVFFELTEKVKPVSNTNG